LSNAHKHEVYVSGEENLKQSENANTSVVQNDEFFNLIMKSQRSRLEDQRTSMNTSKIHSSFSSRSATSPSIGVSTPTRSSASTTIPKVNMVVRPSVTVPPDDAFFSMIQKIQSRRLDEQRSVIKSSKFTLKTSNSGSQMMKKAYDR
jgi:hypothetical protein